MATSYFGTQGHARARCAVAAATADAVRDAHLSGQAQLTSQRFDGLAQHECYYADRFIFLAQKLRHPLSSARI